MYNPGNAERSNCRGPTNRRVHGMGHGLFTWAVPGFTVTLFPGNAHVTFVCFAMLGNARCRCLLLLLWLPRPMALSCLCRFTLHLGNARLVTITSLTGQLVQDLLLVIHRHRRRGRL